ncbi:uncharacterized protein LOC116952979 isoform X1 [Petromyzon marinus]|uniref:NHS-like protein 1 isoform X1 n=1 Tax=Petromyzon marinus TaxID=7757 RepID=A0AAJ7U4S5_PETMA|nr:NHS-like protein 1 isoform X1 [Petromyzon marinus]
MRRAGTATNPVSTLQDESRRTDHFRTTRAVKTNALVPSTRPRCVDELWQSAAEKPRAEIHDQDSVTGSQVSTESPRESVRVTLRAPPPSPAVSSGSAAAAGGGGGSGGDGGSRHVTERSGCCSVTPWSPKCLPRSHVEEDDDEEGDETVAEGRPPSLLRKCRRGPVPNVPCTLDRRTNWTEELPLPTPEQRMRETACQIVSDLVPINVSGSNFERQASARRSFATSESIVRRKKRLQRRKTITGIPEHVRRELGCCYGTDGWRCHSLSRLGNSTFLSALEPRETCDSACQTDDGEHHQQQRRENHRGGALPAPTPHVVSPSERRVRALLHRRDGASDRISRSQGDVRGPALATNAARRATADIDSDDDDDDDNNDKDSGRGGSGGGGSAVGFSARREFGRDLAAGRTPVTDGDRQTRGREDADATTRVEVHRTDSDARDSASSEEGSVFLPSNSSGSDRVCLTDRGADGTETAGDMANLGHGESLSGGTSRLKSNERPKRLVNGVALPPAATHEQYQCTSHGRSRAPSVAHVQGLQLNNGAPVPPGQMPAAATCAAADPDGAPMCRQRGGGATSEVMGKCGAAREAGSHHHHHHHRGVFPETESSERSDAGSMFSEDMDGYYTSMHFDSGLRGRSYSSASSEPSHPGRGMRNRSFSITKLRQKPAPPKRDVSLRRDAQPQIASACKTGASGRDSSDSASLAESRAALAGCCARRAMVASHGEEEKLRALRIYNGTAGRHEDALLNNHRVRDATAAPHATSETPKSSSAFVSTANNGPHRGLKIPNGDVIPAAGYAPHDAQELLGGRASPEGTQLAELRRSLKLDIKTTHVASTCQKNNTAHYEDPWVLRDDSEAAAETPTPGPERATVSSQVPAMTPAMTPAAAAAATPTVRRSESVDSWSYDEMLPSEAYHSLSSSSTATGTTVVECQRLGSDEALSGTSPRAAPSSPATTASSQSKSSSPEKVSSVTSPSSGYSSQSGTPTSLVPAPLFPRSGSPAVVKVKPKVPERTSSLKPPITHRPQPLPPPSVMAGEYREIVANSYPAVPGSAMSAGQRTKPSRESPMFHFPPDPCFVTASLDGILLSRVMSSCSELYSKRGHLVQSASFPCQYASGVMGPLTGGGGGAIKMQDPAVTAVKVLDTHVGKGTPVPDYEFVKLRMENETCVLPKPLPDLLTDSQRPAHAAAPVSAYHHCGAHRRHRHCQPDATKPIVQASAASPHEAQDFMDRKKCADPTIDSSDQYHTSAVPAAVAVGVAAETAKCDISSSARVNRAKVSCAESVTKSNKKSESEPLPKCLDESTLTPATPTLLHQPSPAPPQTSSAGCALDSSGSQLELHSYKDAAPSDQECHQNNQATATMARSPASPSVSYSVSVIHPKSPHAFTAVSSHQGSAIIQDVEHSSRPIENGSANITERVATCNGGSPPWEDEREQHTEVLATTVKDAPGILGKEQEVRGKEAVATEMGEGNARVLQESADDVGDGVFEFQMAKVVAEEYDEGAMRRSSSRSEDDVFVTSPSVSMTTADLFEAIYRSKRKFLCRKESAERGSSDSTPGSPVVTSPIVGSPVLASARGNGSPRLSSPHGRRSQTSQEHFKALLLRKGSRSDAGSRMSAAELLKHTKNAAAAAGSPRPDGTASPLDARSLLARDHCESPAASSPGWQGHSTPGRREHRARHPLAIRAGVRGDGVAISPGARHGPRALRLASVRHSPAMQPISEGEGETAEAAAAADDDDDDGGGETPSEVAGERREEESPSGSKVDEH